MLHRACMSITLAVLLLTGLGGAGQNAAKPQAGKGDWPGWGGPTHDRHSAGAAVTTWGPADHVVWKTAVPGRGHSSPVIVGDRVYLTTADETAKKQFVLAFERKTGQLLWSTVAHEGGFMRMNPKNSHASATPVWDGQRLLSAFLHDDALHVTATDRAGNVLWQKRVGPYTSEHGYGSSLVLHQGRVIVLSDSLKDNYVAALDTKDGAIAWKTERKATGRHGSYATPLVAEIAGRPQLIVTGMGEVTSYDPANGQRLWWCAGPSEVTACTPAQDGKLVFVTGGFPEKEILAIRADGTGDVSKSHVVWRSAKGVAYVPSPLYDAGRLYVLADSGMASCFDAKSGKPLWQERLPGVFTASPVLAGDALYAVNEAGRTYVVSAGPQFQVRSTNDAFGPVLATPAICAGQVFIRTKDSLVCLGQ